jgi:hypothetical protein
MGRHRQPQNVIHLGINAIGSLIRVLLKIQSKLILLQGRKLR